LSRSKTSSEPGHRFGCALVVVTLALGAGGAAAQDVPSTGSGRVPSVAVLDSALAVELRTLQGTQLGLEDAVRLALENSAEALRAEADLRAAEAVVRRERGSFDPELFASGSKTSTDLPTASPFAGADVLETDDVAGSVGVGMKFTTGTELTASLGTVRRSTNSAFATLDPQYDARGSIDLVQPILKGFGRSARADLSAAEYQLLAARANYEGTQLAVRSLVERSYWQLYAAERDVAVEKVLRDAAAALLESADRRARAGLVGPNQVANARVFLADQETALLNGTERLGAASDRLASLVGRRPDSSAEHFSPLGDPPRAFEVAEQDSVVALALRLNHTLRLLENRIGALRVYERAAAWDVLPQLDLVGSLGSSGLAGTGRDVIFGADTLRTDLDTGLGDSWSQVFQGDFPTWSAGLVFRLPIGMRQDRGERDLRRAEVERAEHDLLDAQRNLEEVVRARHRDLDGATDRLRFAKDGVDAAFEQARIGRLEFENGRTTAFELVRLAGDLASAQLRYSQALVRAATAAAELRELTAGAYPPTP